VGIGVFGHPSHDESEYLLELKYQSTDVDSEDEWDNFLSPEDQPDIEDSKETSSIVGHACLISII
jgi:hypothetical protein